ncbi:hypothetical protein ACFYXF_32140 [Streptomyces sp. NPDC002680]|uniref:hypothetical protein n=1 Tax=Streptomyces sp. NPDC002680 TaxID=3364659 RepID=UPI00367CB2AF
MSVWTITRRVRLSPLTPYGKPGWFSMRALFGGLVAETGTVQQHTSATALGVAPYSANRRDRASSRTGPRCTAPSFT